MASCGSNAYPSAVHAWYLAAGLAVGNHLGAGGCHDGRVAAGVVMVSVGVEQLGDLPAAHLRRLQAFLVVQRVDRQGFAGLGAGDQAGTERSRAG